MIKTLSTIVLIIGSITFAYTSNTAQDNFLRIQNQTSENSNIIDRYEMLASYEDCIKIIEEKGFEYEVIDTSEGGKLIKVDDYMTICNKKVFLKLHFPKGLFVGDDYVQFNSNYLTDYYYSIRDVDEEYVHEFVSYFTEIYKEPDLSDFDNPEYEGTEWKLASWHKYEDRIIISRYKGLNANLIEITYYMTEEYWDQKKEKVLVH
ncbi:hypothetical protein [Vallitalea okinawensis]|uniref:hypothetical protein n=1 Tax=Vallitalea okinawensis TaxID=2078660 RepID=UPI000CFCD58A|nr:hypothetical protein [Vallitalea okinawensis]